MNTFQAFKFCKPVARGLRAAGYKKPTPIQAAAIPLALQGKDIIGCAQTGTGKTAAFVLPMIDNLVRNSVRPKKSAPKVLILTPTRELALQVEENVKKYGKYTYAKSLALFGGSSIHRQRNRLRHGVDIIVATPGRLLDHMNRGNIDLRRIKCLVLDEADRMLDMGFIKDITTIIESVPRKRQTMLFSATMPQEIRSLANRIMKDPEYIEIGNRRNPVKSVTQHSCAVKQSDKAALLVEILKSEPIDSVIVFSRTKHRADRIARRLSKKGFKTTVLHSNRSQAQRQRAIKGFKHREFQIMVATDIAARGIDVDHISHVINYDTPLQAEDYIHRIGRTGRAENVGDAITFVGEGEGSYLKGIEKHIGKKLDQLEFEGLTQLISIDPPEKPKRTKNQQRSRRRGKSNRNFRHKKSTSKKPVLTD